MQRRYALKQIAVLIGGVTITPEAMGRALDKATQTLETIPTDQVALLAEMADTILPDTDTPGAKAAKVHEYIVAIVQDCFPPERRDAFWRDLSIINDQCKAMHGQGFAECNGKQRVAFFENLEHQTREQPVFRQSPPFWVTLKDLTLNGYFTSEIGATQALQYDPTPGGWIPDMLIDKNTKAWTSVF